LILSNIFFFLIFGSQKEAPKISSSKLNRVEIQMEAEVLTPLKEGKKVLLDPKWNRQIFAQNVKQIEFINLIKPQFSSILHFVGETKPWQIWCNPAIAEFWWSYAQDLQIDELKPTQISTVEQLVSYSNALHLNGRYEEASIIKTQAIQALYKHIVEPKLKPDYK
jgi:lipopolysaccharide biosynthesis glycosyltransferase